MLGSQCNAEAIEALPMLLVAPEVQYGLPEYRSGRIQKFVSTLGMWGIDRHSIRDTQHPPVREGLPRQ
jgi:hypothetical protein